MDALFLISRKKFPKLTPDESFEALTNAIVHHHLAPSKTGQKILKAHPKQGEKITKSEKSVKAEIKGEKSLKSNSLLPKSPTSKTMKKTF